MIRIFLGIFDISYIYLLSRISFYNFVKNPMQKLNTITISSFNLSRLFTDTKEIKILIKAHILKFY